MDMIYQSAKRSYRTSKETGRTTTVHLPQRVDEWCKMRRLSIAGLVAEAPNWNEQMLAARAEVAELREGLRRKDEKLTELYQDKMELMEFKARMVERMKVK